MSWGAVADYHIDNRVAPTVIHNCLSCGNLQNMIGGKYKCHRMSANTNLDVSVIKIVNDCTNWGVL